MYVFSYKLRQIILQIMASGSPMLFISPFSGAPNTFGVVVEITELSSRGSRDNRQVPFKQ
jgi:hypothetical protein